MTRVSTPPPDHRYVSDDSRPLRSALTPWWRWLFLVPGLVAVGVGGYGLWTDLSASALGSWAVWFVGSALVNDLLVAPVWIALGWLAARVLPRPARAPAVVGVAVSGAVSLVALPFLLGFGGDPGDYSFEPRNYGLTLLVVVGVVLAVSAAWAAVRVQRARDSA
ncbi:hypothetical protein [Klenkia sp. PcliD-1-E]|uniref:hypothetical protein n=1 Tax=Klenkia sp. PcliD-1-E TaxID=2954492 RepID=UPI0020983CB9|nr:hypothetical protein [Klenkia sp. PcliD-1-E]MCO7219332.1 hypothetical protein [Klenkia sp. PcliD-1-E]